jgi:hypothetical protein
MSFLVGPMGFFGDGQTCQRNGNASDSIQNHQGISSPVVISD